jgi:hypothetical protein
MNDYLYSHDNNSWDLKLGDPRTAIGGWWDAPNTSAGYHGLLYQWWEHYGLGKQCLLMSESNNVKTVFENTYPNTKFITTDYFVELTSDLHPDSGGCDILWDLYKEIPDTLEESTFTSIISQATLEHLHNPIDTLRKLCRLLEYNGLLFLHTHLPNYAYHAYPKDYLRYWPDWFVDMAISIPEFRLEELVCVEGHALSVYRKIDPNANIHYVDRGVLFSEAVKSMLPTHTVLDIGPGILPQKLIPCDMHILCEPCEEYVKHLRERIPIDSDKHLIINTDWQHIVTMLSPKSVDTVMLLDVIEHLPILEGKELLAKTLILARKQVIVFTTLGFIPQCHPDGIDAWGLHGGTWQEHKSGWMPEDFGPDWTFFISTDYHSYEHSDGSYKGRLQGAMFAIYNVGVKL